MALIPPSGRLACTRAACSMLAICLLSPAAFAQEAWVGRQFMPREGIQAKVREETIPHEQLSLPLVVENVQGKWLWVGNAWVRKTHVVPLEDAAIYYTDYIRGGGGDQEWAFRLRGIAWMAQGELVNAVKDFTEAIRQNPASAESYYARGRTRELQRDYDRTVKDYERAIKIDPANMEVWNALAWLLATCPNKDYRNGPFAVTCAAKACELSEWKNAATFDTLAAAYAEAGDFEQAVHWQRKAVASIGEELKNQCLARLALYEAGRPYREGAAPPPAVANSPMPRPAEAQDAGRQEMTILIVDGALTINGRKLAFPYQTAEMIAVLGEPNRMLLTPQQGGDLDGLTDNPEEASAIVWDEAGLSASRTMSADSVTPPGVPPQTDWIDPVTSLAIVLHEVPNPQAETIPGGSFSGKFRINGAVVTADSTAETLNQSLPDQSFGIESDWYTAELDGLRIVLVPVLAEGEANSAGASLGAVVLSWPNKPLVAEENGSEISISVDAGVPTINGTKLALPCKTSKLIALLGKPTRIKGLVHIWGEHGVTAVQPKESDQITKLTVALGKDAVGLLFGASPKQQFQGTLTIDGMPVSAGSTIEEINQARKGKPFQESKGRYVVRHGNVNVFLRRADPDFNSEGVNLSVLSVEAE